MSLEVITMSLKGLYKARRLCGMSQKDLAHCLCVSKNTVSRWERGTVTPRVPRLKEIAEALNCSIKFLITGEDD